jgi:hypothetical protein
MRRSWSCLRCRRFLHGLLDRCLRRYGAEQIAFVLLPVPLESRCNPAITVVEPGREGACEYARLALAVWQAAPERFAEFDAVLRQGVAVYEEAGLGVLPKLLFSRVVIAGQPSNITELYEALEQHLGIEMSP